jgi:hypothetical protein
MANADKKPVVNQRSDDWKEGNPIQPDAEPAAERVERVIESLSEMRKASEDLEARIAVARRRNGMPIDSALGNPHWERDAADGRFDVPDEEDG